MIVNLQQVQRGITNYVEQEIATKATGLNKFATYFILPSLNAKIEDFYNKSRENPMFKDFFDSSANMDLDKIYSTAKNAIQKSGQFEAMGIIFNESDVDKLYSYIKQTQI